ncbi:hypothetical protein ACVIRO_001236 [Rhizobium ruizarguesonis]
MITLYDDVIGGVRKTGVAFDKKQAAREYVAILNLNYPPSIYGTKGSLKPCHDGGAEVHLTRFERA